MQDPTVLLDLHVADEASARAWLLVAVHYFGRGYHPDTRGGDYVDRDGTPTFTPAEAKQFDLQTERILDVLPDAYETAYSYVARLDSPYRRDN